MKQIYKNILNQSTILLIEDEDALRMSFKKLLKLFVNKVIEASNGEEGLALFNSNRVDIIITDVKMPKIDGIEFIKKIRNINREIPIIITSAYSNQEYLLEAIKLSLVEYILKPIKERDLELALIECAKRLSDKFEHKECFSDNFCYDYENKLFNFNKEIITLTTKEVEFIELLLEHRGNLVTKTAIEDRLYIYKEAPPSALKNLVFKLRKKLPKNIIVSNGKLGYLIK